MHLLPDPLARIPPPALRVTSVRQPLAAAALAGLLAVASLPAAAEVPKVRDGWIELNTVNFRLVSEAGERKTAEIGLSLERFRVVLARLAPGLTLESPVPTTIVAFENDRSFAPYKDQSIRQRQDMLGFFLSHRHGNFIALNAFPRGLDSLRVIFHEYVHFFVRHNLPFLPLWANEGLAEYYSTFEELGGEVLIGAPVGHHARLLKGRTFIPLERLFAIDVSSPEYNEAAKQGVFYAQSWALMHFLLSDQSPKPGAAVELLQRLSAGEPPPAAVRAALGVSLAELEARLRGYANSGRYAFASISLGELDAPGGYQVRPMKREEVLFELGGLLAHSVSTEQHEAAEEHFQAALAAHPAYPEPYAGLGLVAEERGDHARATELLSQAVERGSKRPETLLLLADVLLAPLRGMIDPALPGVAATAERARGLLEQVLAARPSFGEAEALLGTTYFFSSQGAAAGIPHLERAVRLLPDRSDVAYNLVLLHVIAGDTREARRVAERELAARGRAKLAAEASEAIERADLVAASNEASDRGDGERAVELFRKAVERTSEAGLKAVMQKQLAALEAQAKANRDVERYNRAVELANQGDVDAAVKHLRALLAGLPEGSLREASERLLAELEDRQP